MNRDMIDRFNGAKDTTAKNLVAFEYFIQQKTLFEQREIDRGSASEDLPELDELAEHDRVAVQKIARQVAFVADHEWKGKCRWCKGPGLVGEKLKWLSGHGFVHAEHFDGKLPFDTPKRKGKK